MANNNSTPVSITYTISNPERYERVNQFGLPLCGEWLAQAGFSAGMPVKIRVMPKCIVITVQDIDELWHCAEGLSLEPFNASAALSWLKRYPGGLVIS